MIIIRKPDALLSKLLPPISLRPHISYIPSQYALHFEHRGKQYVFNNLTKQCIEGCLPAKVRAGEGYDDLIFSQFLVPEDKDECAYYNSISALIRAYSRKKGEHSYIILPTLGCNAQCIYCYEEGMKPVTMSSETVEQTIRYIISSHAGDLVKIVWFGGEPLLGEAIIDRICEGLQKAGVCYKSAMITNGSLITPKIVEKMTSSWRVERIQVSMDGAEKDYAARKRYNNEKDHYHSVIMAIDEMADKGIKVQVRSNVDEENWDGVSSFLEDMKAGVRCKDQVSVYFAPLYQIRKSERAIPFWEKVIASRSLIENAGFRAGIVKEEGGTSFRTNFCMADGGSVVICPDGVLSPCEHLQQKAGFGDVWHGVTDDAARYEFCRTDRTREKCRRCPFLPNCTSFSSCPVQDTHCRELRELMSINALRRMVEKEEAEDIDEDPIC